MRPTLFPLVRNAVASVFCTSLALVATPGVAADCEAAIRNATHVAALGDRAFRTDSTIEAGNTASSARFPTLDAIQGAKACGCLEAVPALEDAALAAARANIAFGEVNARLYGSRIKKDADEALEALRRCAAR